MRERKTGANLTVRLVSMTLILSVVSFASELKGVVAWGSS